MNIRMNYTKDGVTKEVSCLGFAKDNGWATRSYCECFDEDRGHFIARIEDLSLSEKSVVDFMLEVRDLEKIGNVMNDIINNEKGE